MLNGQRAGLSTTRSMTLIKEEFWSMEECMADLFQEDPDWMEIYGDTLLSSTTHQFQTMGHHYFPF